jgi:NADPH-dependent ferric siderophore reductase
VRNYTVRDARRIDGRWQADVDFVVHTSAGGQVEGVAAAWALRAQPGQTVGLLDQGVIFNHGDADGLLMVAADETGLPAAEGVARSLPPDARALFVLEVAHDDDIRPLQTEADIEVRWAVRRDAGALPGRAAFALVRDAVFDHRGYVYAVGEASFVTDTRKFAQAAGVPSEQVDFCAYWRPSRRRAV